MSTALAIAGVTQLLRDLLNDGLVDNDVAAAIGTNVSVHARPPDRLEDVAADASVLNVFLYRVDNQPNWANQVLPTRDGLGRRVNATPLTLDLYYLISAFTSEDLHADILLGYAMQILHEHPGLDRDEIQLGLSPAPPVAGGLPPALQALAATGLADQVDQLRITPTYLGVEEMTKLWTAFQAGYRTSMAYRVSSVIIEAEEPASLALPVLTIGPGNTGPLVRPDFALGLPQLSAIVLPAGQPSARPGDAIVLRGRGLEGSDLGAVFTSPTLDAPLVVAPDAGGNATTRTFTLPDVPGDWAAGLYQLTFQARAEAAAPLRGSNAAALQVAPIPTLPPASVVRNGDDIVVTLSMRPNIWPGQRVELALGGMMVAAPPRTTALSETTFTFPGLEAGAYPVRLRVDGVESWLVVREVAPVGPDFAPEPPVFDPTQTITVPA